MKSSVHQKFSVLLLFWSIFCLTDNLIAQDLSNRFGVGLIVGPVKMIGGQVDRSTIDQWAGIQLNYGYSPSLTFNGSLAYGWVYPRDPKGSQFQSKGKYKTFLIPFNVNLIYYLQPQYTVRPYVSFGVGITTWDVRELGNNVSTFSQGKSISGSQVNAALIGGFGLEFIHSRDYVVNVIINYHRLLKGNEDTIGYGDDGNNGIAELRLGISYFFGGFRDRDKDGIEDKFDVDPFRKEDIDGFKDTDGAPDYDNDNDGIIDSRDKAPNDPEDIDGFMDKDGIPDPDNDGDTIKDVEDKCPNIPEDFDEFEDQDGCPEFDNDNDGIPDSLDQCPNWPEDLNGYMDEDGCPDEKPEEPNPEPFEIGRSTILKDVTFASGSARLNPKAFPVLNELVKTLIDHPNIEIEIRGYTDNTGYFYSNQTLSERRAFAVTKYLIDHGVNPRQLRSVGYGELDPIAPNTTWEGRAANRRIEFVRIK